MPPDPPPVSDVHDAIGSDLMSAQNGLAFEVRTLQRDLEGIDAGPDGDASDAVLALVRAARRFGRLANEIAADPTNAGKARDEVSLARVTDACLADGGGRVEVGDLEAAIALIAKRLGPPAGVDAGEAGRIQRTLAAVTKLQGATGE
jgi:hypothetical protein